MAKALAPSVTLRAAGGRFLSGGTDGGTLSAPSALWVFDVPHLSADRLPAFALHPNCLLVAHCPCRAWDVMPLQSGECESNNVFSVGTTISPSIIASDFKALELLADVQMTQTPDGRCTSSSFIKAVADLNAALATWPQRRACVVDATSLLDAALSLSDRCCPPGTSPSGCSSACISTPLPPSAQLDLGSSAHSG